MWDAVDPHESRLLLQHVAGGVGRHERARLRTHREHGSINGQGGQYGQVNYAAAKSGIHGFTKALAQEGAAKGITVNAVAPGYTDTDMVRRCPSASWRRSSQDPGRAAGRGREIARGVMLLVADDAGFITGSTLSINGGQHMY